MPPLMCCATKLTTWWLERIHSSVGINCLQATVNCVSFNFPRNRHVASSVTSAARHGTGGRSHGRHVISGLDSYIFDVRSTSSILLLRHQTLPFQACFGHKFNPASKSGITKLTATVVLAWSAAAVGVPGMRRGCPVQCAAMMCAVWMVPPLKCDSDAMICNEGNIT